MKTREGIYGFARNAEEQQTIKRALDLIDQAVRTFTPQISHFLHPGQIALYRYVNNALKAGGVSSLHWGGGYAHAERCRCVVVPDGYEWFDEDYDLAVLRFKTKQSDVVLEHRDILGALLGLGLNRQVIGDIISHQNPAYAIVESPLALFIQANLVRVKHEVVKIDLVSERELANIPAPDLKSRTISVASMRLDAIIAAVYGISRSRAAEMIRQGKVKIDFRVQLVASSNLTEGNLISCRGYGRFKVLQEMGLSKKGRIRLNIGLIV